jgi:predicted nucleic acid-binding protein
MSGSSNYLLDTNIVLYLLNGDKVLAEIIDNKTPYISFITEMELLSFHKLSTENEMEVKVFLAHCHIVDMNAKIKAAAIDIRKKCGLKLPDSIIAATSEFLNISMLTADSEFNKLKSLHILQYKR